MHKNGNHTVSACNNGEIGLFDGKNKQTNKQRTRFSKKWLNCRLSKLCENQINIQHNAVHCCHLNFLEKTVETTQERLSMSMLEEIVLIVPFVGTFICAANEKKKRIGGVNGAIHLMGMSHCQDNNILHNTHHRSSEREKPKPTTLVLMSCKDFTQILKHI